MSDYPWWHAPVEPADVHTADNAVPPLDIEFTGTLDDLANIHPGIEQILAGITLLAKDRLTADQTQTLLSTIAGHGGADITGLLALLVKRLTNPATNPGLRHLDPDTAKGIQGLGEQYAYETAEFAPRDRTSEAAALIDGI